jgi:hypothetical protein
MLVLVANVSDDARKVCDEVCSATGFLVELLEFRIYLGLIDGNRRQTFLLWKCHEISLGRYGINDLRYQVFRKETQLHPPFAVTVARFIEETGNGATQTTPGAGPSSGNAVDTPVAKAAEQNLESTDTGILKK